MTPNAEILLEGSYLYFQKEVNYSQENFKLTYFPEIQNYHIYSEILSRIETGEFLKILVRLEMDNHFFPFFIRTEKSIGNKYAQEIYQYDNHTQELKYTFQNAQNTQEFKRLLNAKHYLTSPAFATSTLFTLSKKFDTSARTPVIMVGASNEWTYENPPEDKVVFGEYKSRDVPDFQVNNSTLSASHLALYEFDSTHPSAGDEEPTNIYISKHWGIPYQLTHKDQKIVIKNLKKNST